MADPQARAAEGALIAAVIITFKDLEGTKACLASVAAARPAPELIVLVENGSPPPFADELSAWVPTFGPPWRIMDDPPTADDVAWLREPSAVTRFAFIRSKRNAGFSGGINTGWRYVRQHPDLDGILILNNDATADPGFFGPLAEAFRDPAVGIATGTIHHDEHAKLAWYAGGKLKWWQCRGQHWNVPCDAPIDVTFSTGCMMVIRARLLEELGGLPELYFIYYEDVELSMRAAKLGFTLRYVPSSIVYHEISKTTGHRTVAPRTAFLSARNRFWVARRNLSWPRRMVATVNMLADEAGRLLGAVARGRFKVAKAIASGIRWGLFVPPTEESGRRILAELERRAAAPMHG